MLSSNHMADKPGKKEKTNKQDFHDILVKHVLGQEANVRDFLSFVLPVEIKQRLNLGKISYDVTTYISPQYRKNFSDLVVKSEIDNCTTDIYILIEHKSGFNTPRAVFVQIIKYIYLMLQHDLNEDKDLRIVIPLVLYHGKRSWTVPPSFRDLFSVHETIKPFIPDFRYLIFNTGKWNESEDIALQKMHNNVLLLSFLLLLKTAYETGTVVIEKVIKLWYNNKLFSKFNLIELCFQYLVYIRDLKEEDLEELFERAGIDGGKIMPTIVDKWIEKGMEKGIEKGELNEKRSILTKLMVKKFTLTDEERALINQVEDFEKLDRALDVILSAENKQQVLQCLR